MFRWSSLIPTARLTKLAALCLGFGVIATLTTGVIGHLCKPDWGKGYRIAGYYATPRDSFERWYCQVVGRWSWSFALQFSPKMDSRSVRFVDTQAPPWLFIWTRTDAELAAGLVDGGLYQTIAVGWPLRCFVADPYQLRSGVIAAYRGTVNATHTGPPLPGDVLPTGIIALSLAANIAIWSALPASILCPFGLLSAVRSFRAGRRRRRGLCVACAYPVAPAAICSECGHPSAAPLQPKTTAKGASTTL